LVDDIANDDYIDSKDYIDSQRIPHFQGSCRSLDGWIAKSMVLSWPLHSGFNMGIMGKGFYSDVGKSLSHLVMQALQFLESVARFLSLAFNMVFNNFGVGCLLSVFEENFEFRSVSYQIRSIESFIDQILFKISSKSILFRIFCSIRWFTMKKLRKFNNPGISKTPIQNLNPPTY
jgi:hypothetical protein